MTTLNTIIEERHNAREEEFAKLARSVKARIEQQKTPNEEGANKALQILIDTHHHQLQKAREEERDRYKKYLKYHYENYGIESLRELITTPLDHSELDQPTLEDKE